MRCGGMRVPFWLRKISHLWILLLQRCSRGNGRLQRV